uniref:Mitochondrial import protein 1 n=1 Tax=Candidozyma auris TaxID=498019 RepID=A0A0L0NV02_CANAR
MSIYLAVQHTEGRPNGVSDLEEANDVTVISAQLSSDELVSNEDITTTHSIIEAGRHESEQKEKEKTEVKYNNANGQLVVSFNIWNILKKGAINLVLPFINGIMLGFGEIFAHEVGFKYGFVGARVQPPRRQVQAQAQTKSRFI